MTSNAAVLDLLTRQNGLITSARATARDVGAHDRLAAWDALPLLGDRLRVPGSEGPVEVDGWAWHMDVERFRADRHKATRWCGATSDLLRFTRHDLTTRPDYVLGEIRAAPATSS